MINVYNMEGFRCALFNYDNIVHVADRNYIIYINAIPTKQKLYYSILSFTIFA